MISLTGEMVLVDIHGEEKLILLHGREEQEAENLVCMEVEELRAMHSRLHYLHLSPLMHKSRELPKFFLFATCLLWYQLYEAHLSLETTRTARPGMC
jgi:hypothetical protein